MKLDRRVETRASQVCLTLNTPHFLISHQLAKFTGTSQQMRRSERGSERLAELNSRDTSHWPTPYQSVSNGTAIITLFHWI